MPTVITAERPDSTAALKLLSELDKELWRHPYPPQSRHAFTVEKLLRENVDFFVARVDDRPAACGGIKLFGLDYGELKRMYVAPGHRRMGLGRAILNHLADHARQHQVGILRLETGIYQVAAIGMYERFGFERRPPFGEYREDPLSVYFEKYLT